MTGKRFRENTQKSTSFVTEITIAKKEEDGRFAVSLGPANIRPFRMERETKKRCFRVSAKNSAR
jgi:hypothetical protein